MREGLVIPCITHGLHSLMVQVPAVSDAVDMVRFRTRASEVPLQSSADFLLPHAMSIGRRR